MKKVLLALSALVTLLCGCGEKEKATLNLYNWADYINEDQLTAFEEEFDCKVILDTFESNESMYAKLKAGAKGYDVIFPSSYMTDIMQKQAMLIDLDRSKLSNIKNIDPSFKDILFDKELKHSIPYCFSYTGIGYRKDKIKEAPTSWDAFNDDSYKGRITLLNDIREAMGSALIKLGYSINTTNEKEINEAADLLIQWKKNIAKFDNELFKTGLDSGEFVMVQGYSSDVSMVAAENENIGVVFPVEGMVACLEDMVIPTSSDNVELAHQFINFMLRPEVAAANIDWNMAQIPNSAAYELIDPELLKNEIVFLPEEQVKKCELIKDVGDAIALYSKAWDRVKAAN